MKKIILLIALMTLAFATSQVHAQSATSEPIVRAVMFWMDGCPHCEDVIQNVLPPLREKHGARFELFMIEVANVQDVDMLYRVAASYDIPKEQTGVPFLIIGDQVLVGSDQVANRLPALIDDYLTQGGVDFPSNPVLADILPTTLLTSPSTSELPAVTEPSLPADTAPITSLQSNGFALAIVIMVGMGSALLYSLIAFAFGKIFSMPAWADWLIPALIIIGIGVAGYLSYVETQSVNAICGPVGDCNAVQQSRYATLFGFLPVGVLGLLGYLGMLAAWLTRKYLPKFVKPANITFFGMAVFAVIFSLYLTYLEPFVIKAVCIWCLSSAVIVTLLLLIGTPPAIRPFAISDEDE
jgi:uncharacterized membrane protein